MLKSSGTSEDSSSLCSIIHHLWLQNSLGSPWGYTLYPDGKTPAPLRACLLPNPVVDWSIQPVPSLPCSHQSHQKKNQKQAGASHLLISCSLALFENHLPNQKAPFSRLAACLSLLTMMTFWQMSQKQLTLLYTVFLLFFSVGLNLYIFTHHETIWSPLRMLICTSINSYLKDKSKHVCFLFVFFPLLNSPKAFMSTLVIRTREGFSWRRGAEDALMYS